MIMILSFIIILHIIVGVVNIGLVLSQERLSIGDLLEVITISCIPILSLAYLTIHLSESPTVKKFLSIKLRG